MSPGDEETFIFYYAFDSLSHLDTLGKLSLSEASISKRVLFDDPLSSIKSRIFLNYQTSSFSLTNYSNSSDIEVNQIINIPFTMPITPGVRSPGVVLSAKHGAGYALTLNLNTAQLGSIATSSDTSYLFYRMNVNFGTSSDPEQTWFLLGRSSTPSYSDLVTPPVGVVPQVDYLVFVTSISQNITYTISNVYEYRPLNLAALILGLLFGLLFLFFLIFLILFLIRKYGAPRPPTVIRRIIRRKKEQFSNKDAEPLAPAPTPAPAPAPANGPTPVTKRHVVNIDYLMTGARRVVVKDGNPSAMKVVDEAPPVTPLPDDEEEIVIEETVDDGDDPCGWFTNIFKKPAQDF